MDEVVRGTRFIDRNASLSVTVRQWAKYRICGYVGAFSYFGFKVYFPKGATAFRLACEAGIFEAGNVRMLQGLCSPGSVMFDVGANLGLMAVPVLQAVPNARVVSFEPSPNALPWLRRTIAESGVGRRWQLIEKAACASLGSGQFSISSCQMGLFDGLRHTLRVAQEREVTVPLTTLDFEWERLGCPPVSIVKIDVEGGELDVLRGGPNCLATNRPYLLLEWNPTNLKAYGIQIGALFDWAEQHRYDLYALPEIVPINTSGFLALQVTRTESFLLAPQTLAAG